MSYMYTRCISTPDQHSLSALNSCFPLKSFRSGLRGSNRTSFGAALFSLGTLTHRQTDVDNV